MVVTGDVSNGRANEPVGTRAVTRTRHIGPLVAIVVGGLIAALSVIAALLLNHSVANQNQALLRSQAGQITAEIESALTSATPQLVALQDVAAATNSNPAAFMAVAKDVTQPGATVVLARNGRVVAVYGSAFTEGEQLPPSITTAIAKGPPRLFSLGVVKIGGKSFVAVIVGPRPGRDAVLEGEQVDPSKTVQISRGPFAHVRFALYAAPTAQANQLIFTSARPLPLTGPVVTNKIPIGTSRTSKWLIVTGADSPLAGAWPNAFPWILLVVGLMFAVVVATLVNVVARRERYAQELVAERTVELESAQEEIVHRERLSAVGEMATMIGHELRNPLGAAINGLYLARHGLGDQVTPQVTKGLDLAERETQRAATLADDLTAYMRERRPSLERIELGSAVDQVLEATPPPDGIDVRVDGRDVPIDADAAQLTQILSNLVTNAYQAMPDGGSVEVGASAADGHVDIVVEDTGPGLDPKAETRAFDPFFTTKAQGTGLGLAIVQRMAEAHGGSVRLENREAGGARVVIRLPRADLGSGG